MSMNLSIKHASELEMARFVRHGIDANALVGGKLDEVVAQLLAMTGGRSSIFGALGNMGRRRGATGTGAALHLDKSWHILHWLYTGQAWGGPMPAAMLLEGGREVGEDLGYGPARIVTAEPTAQFAQFLAGQSVAALQARIDARAMMQNNIYCVDDDGIATRTDIAAEVAHYAPLLTKHVQDAAQKQQGLLIWMM